MRLPRPGTLEKKKVLETLVDTLLSPFCAAFEKGPGCSKPAPSPAPVPAPSPTPAPAPAPNPAPTRAPPPIPDPPAASPNPPAAAPTPPAPTPSSKNDPPAQRPPPDVPGPSNEPDTPNSRPAEQSPPVAAPTPIRGGDQAGGETAGGTGTGTGTSAGTGTGTDGNGSANESGFPKAAGHVLLVAPGGDVESQSTPVAGSGSGGSSAARPSVGVQGGDKPTPTTVLAPVSTSAGSSSVGDFSSSGVAGGEDDSGVQQGSGAGSGGGGGSGSGPAIGSGSSSGSAAAGSGSSTASGDGGCGSSNGCDDGSAGSTQSSPVPGIVGGVIALVILLLVLLALLLYRYRRTRRVQTFLIKFAPFKISPYTKAEKKRSSMGAGLLFSCAGPGESPMNEKRSTLDYGTILPAPVTQPNPARAPPERPDAPLLDAALVSNKRSSTPVSPFLDDASPLSPGFPKSPSPTVPRRSSQDSVGAASVASSGMFSPSLVDWPMPPSAAPSIMSSPPSTSHGPLPEFAPRFQLMSFSKPGTPLNGQHQQQHSWG
ncbi:hypothetical protein VTK56DRAFT_6485 [Thermocarpiscus australiensis]